MQIKQFPVAALACAALLSVVPLFISGCASGGGSSSTTTTTTGNTAPLAISAVSPTNVPVGSAATPITVTGTGFANGAVISLNGAALTTSYVSATQLSAVAPAAQLATGAVLSVSVSSSGNTVKADPTNVAVSVDNPVPTFASITPTAAQLGTADTTVTVTGTSFVQGVALWVNGTPRPSTYVSDTQFTAQLPASDFSASGSLPLNVINPKPGGGTSGTRSFAVNNPIPAITALSPSTVLAGAADTAVTLTGTGLLPSTTLQINGATHAATAATGGTQLTFVLSAAELASASTLGVTVANPLPGGGASAAANFLVKNPAPVISAAAPTTLLAGGDATRIALTGTGFVKSSTVQLNGSTHLSSFVSATEIDVPLTAAELGSSGTLALNVTNSAPGGGASAGVSVPVNNPTPTILSLTPSSITVGAADTNVIVAGTGFLPVTTLQINGKSHAITYNNNKQATVTLTAAELSSAASDNLVLSNPTPGGGSSSGATLTVGSAAPAIASLSPAALPVGSSATTVTITGAGFVPTSTVQFGSSVRTNATYVSSTQMTLPLTATDLAYAGSYSIYVLNPAVSGGASKSFLFVVQAKTPLLATLAPTSLITNAGSQTLTATGANFSSLSKLVWNGTELSTSYQSTYNYGTNSYTYVLFGNVPAELTSSTGTASVTVTTSTASSPSNALTVAVTDPPVPTISSVTPATVPVRADAKITVAGSGFNKSSVLSYNGSALTTAFTSSTSLTATVPANLLSLPGNGAVTVATPAPGGGTSAAAALTVYLPVVSNNMVFNPVNGLAYLSIPSTGSTVTGNSIVSFDPGTGTLGTPIFVGSEPGVMAISDDGKTLWVALNGTSAIRKVDLVNAVAGAQYSAYAVTNYYSSTYPVTAMLVMPGTSDLVAVASSSYLGLYDNGTLRGSAVSANGTYGLQADKGRGQLYAGGTYNTQIFTYGTSGLTLKFGGSTNYSYNITSANFDEMQLADGKIITDYGRVYDSESGGLLGSFLQGTTTVSGPTLYDSGLGQVYVLNNVASSYSYNYSQVSLYRLSDYSSTGKSFPWNIPSSVTDSSGNSNSNYLYPHRLTRWGSNGLLLHTKYALFTAQSNVIKDQSSVNADLSVTAAASGGTATGSIATYTLQVKNAGPQPATDVSLSVQAPTTGVMQGLTSSVGACPTLNGCTLGTLASGATATITAQVLQTTAGTSALTANVQGSTTDPTPSNNTATTSLTVTGDTYNLAPTLVSLSPNAIKTGSADTLITVTGTNFAAGSQIMLGTTALSTKLVSSTQLTATVPMASLANLTWYSVSVNTPAPGGGTSPALPLTVFNVVTVGLNHIAYEPYSRKLYASVSTGSSSVSANSIASIDPATGSFGVPVTFATAPNLLALSSSGKTLVASLTLPTSGTVTSNPFGRVDLTTGLGEADNVTVGGSYYYSSAPAIGSLALQPGSETALAIAPSYGYPGLYDYSASAKSFVLRGSVANGNNASGCLNFLDGTNLFGASYGAYLIPVTSSGLGNLKSLSAPAGCVQFSGSTAADTSGRIFSVTSAAQSQVGAVALPNTYSVSGSALVPDAGLGSVFYVANTTNSTYSGYADGLVSYDLKSFLRTSLIGLNIPAIEGSSYSFAFNDLVRWGQDGLALVTSTGHLYLLRGPFVVPQELNTNSAATLTASSAPVITSGTDNKLLTLTGSNFLPGVAVNWNGSYRTTTIVDATHVTVAIPASDLASAGSAKLTAVNPGAAASAALTVTIQ